MFDACCTSLSPLCLVSALKDAHMPTMQRQIDYCTRLMDVVLSWTYRDASQADSML